MFIYKNRVDLTNVFRNHKSIIQIRRLSNILRNFKQNLIKKIDELT